MALLCNSITTASNRYHALFQSKAKPNVKRISNKGKYFPRKFHLVSATLDPEMSDNVKSEGAPTNDTKNTLSTLATIPPLLTLGYFSLGNIFFPSFGNTFLGLHSTLNILSGFASFGASSSGSTTEYSKFASESLKEAPQSRISSKSGMLLFYSPALFLSAIYFASSIFGIDFESALHLPFSIGVNGDTTSLRLTLLSTVVMAHFLKRVLETLFLHKYSGYMSVSSARIIPVHYFLTTLSMLWCQFLVEPLPSLSINLIWPGVIVSFFGMAGNLYHHYVLSTLRSNPEEGYKIPRGGLFHYVICPHYLFEIIGFLGFVMIGQTFSGLAAFAFTGFYLAGRSRSTLDWYKSKFPEFPKERKALIPFLF